MAMIEINTNPSRGELRYFGLLLAVFFGVVGAILAWRFQAWPVARGLWIGGAAAGVVYYAIPPIRRWMYVGWMYLAFPIGWVISHIMMAAIYYLVFTPIGLFMRLLGRDPLSRSFDESADTYWVEHQPDENPDRYFRQF